MSESTLAYNDDEWAVLSASCADDSNLTFTPTDFAHISKSVGSAPSPAHKNDRSVPHRRSSSRLPIMHPRFYAAGNNNSSENLISASSDSVIVETNTPPIQRQSIAEEDIPGLSMMHNRQKYYNKLVHHTDDRMRIPDHVLPSSLFYVIPTKSTGKQSSIVTIFAIWNTMMGTSLLSMPWGIGQAGFTLGVLLIVFLGAMTLYTAYRVLKSKDYLDYEAFEFSDVCKHYLGGAGEWVAIIFSLVTFIGGMMVYWVLMTNFLYVGGIFIHDRITGNNNETNLDEVLCPTNVPIPHNGSHNATSYLSLYGTNETDNDISFSPAWTSDRTVPIYLALIVFPLLNFKSPTIFTKFNCMGTLSVFFVLSFVITKAATWGWNFQFDLNPDPSGFQLPEFRLTFPALTGMLSLAFFLHSAVITIMKNNAHPERNVRDLSLGYMLVALTYLTVGVLFYGTFPLPKSCISSNLLENLSTSDVFATGARFFLLFQMLSVFPLLAYMYRVNALYALFNTAWPGRLHVIVVNISILIICVLIAMFFPHIGEIIRYSGSLCGLIYVFCLPSMIHMLSLKSEDRLSWPSTIAHSLIILLGLANFISQFLITPSV